MTRTKECPECGGRNLYETRVSAGGGYAPNYLHGLESSIWKAAKFRLVLCQDCGLTRWFAPEEARPKASESKKWTRVS
jgi:predicted nucleic-acid-binding Zn-ribbon protein